MKSSKGFTLIETLFALGIFFVFVIIISAFGRDIFFLNNITQSDLNAQTESRRVLRTMTSELREASPSSLGAYSIAQAATSSLTFFSNIDADSAKEQVRYFIQNEELKKGVVKPSGNPLVYNQGSETVTTLITDVTNGSSTPLFEYYDTNYSGTTTPLTLPVDIPSVRLVKISVIIERNPYRTPLPLYVVSSVTIRNLKDNL